MITFFVAMIQFFPIPTQFLEEAWVSLKNEVLFMEIGRST